MAVIPKIPKTAFVSKRCAKCGAVLDAGDFAQTHSIFYPDGRLPVCNGCIGRHLKEQKFEWDAIDKVCQWADLPFIVREWERLAELNGPENTWPVYSKVFADDCYQNLGWEDYFHQYQKLREAGQIEEELPKLDEAKWARLREVWGANYDESSLRYLEDLFKGLCTSQNVSGELQKDQARKICKLSLEIDSRIRAGDKEVDKFMSSYDKLIKTAEFTPKNTRNAADFDSSAELWLWLEKRGHQNKFYDNVTRDVIDETLKNVENYNQRLYINEGGIGDEITNRIKALQELNSLESEKEKSLFDLQTDFAPDEYDNAGFEDEEFNPGEGVD